MKLKTATLFFVFSFLSLSKIFAQSITKDSCIFTPMFTFSYSYQIPGANLADRFGDNSNIGFNFLIKTNKNWIAGVDFNYLFGGKIKENNIFDSISTSSGEIIDGNGMIADIKLYERGFYTSVKFGKIFPVLSSNKNSGIMLIGSVGLLQHKIRIEVTDNVAPQLKDDYKKGYDRLTNGLGISEFVGYAYLGNSRTANFFAGIEFTQAWTQCRRDFNFDTMQKDTSKRLDLLYGIKVGWIIPLYKRQVSEFYYY
jgi:hypothetical protein